MQIYIFIVLILNEHEEPKDTKKVSHGKWEENV